MKAIDLVQKATMVVFFVSVILKRRMTMLIGNFLTWLLEKIGFDVPHIVGCSGLLLLLLFINMIYYYYYYYYYY